MDEITREDDRDRHIRRFSVAATNPRQAISKVPQIGEAYPDDHHYKAIETWAAPFDSTKQQFEVEVSYRSDVYYAMDNNQQVHLCIAN